MKENEIKTKKKNFFKKESQKYKQEKERSKVG
jgi:hypothetical protein